jgi:hypothetical protein
MVASVKTYQVEVSRDGKFWFVQIPELSRATQALRYKDVSVMANELIEIMTGLARDEYEVQLTVHLPDAVNDHLARAEVLREEATKNNAAAAAESRAAVRELLAQGISQREAGELLGLSFQRVNQLARA